MAEIKLSTQECEEYFLNALCNGGAYVNAHGVDIDVENEEDYKTAKRKLQGDKPNLGISYEDVWMEVLRMGKKLKMTDIEGEGEYTRTIELKDVHERVPLTPIDHLTAMIEECDDAITADVILQQVFLNEQVFG